MTAAQMAISGECVNDAVGFVDEQKPWARACHR
jgi:hypothetical protein